MQKQETKNPTRSTLLEIYNRLFSHFGPQYWWPADSAFEMIVGAVLTQNTSWRNVELAMARLKTAKTLDPAKMRALTASELEDLIQPSGFFRLKTARLVAFLDLLYRDFSGCLSELFLLSQAELRKTLLGLKGFGPETVDCILLYAAQKPSFVIDAYTRRIFSRHHLLKKDDKYAVLQDFFMENLDPDVSLFGEYHALIVQTAKVYCKTKVNCLGCPLEHFDGFQAP